MLARVLRICGLVWVYLAAAIILLSYGFILVQSGIWEFWRIVSPWNIWNWIAVLLTVSPGFFLIWLAEKLSRPNKTK